MKAAGANDLSILLLRPKNESKLGPIVNSQQAE